MINHQSLPTMRFTNVAQQENSGQESQI